MESPRAEKPAGGVQSQPGASPSRKGTPSHPREVFLINVRALFCLARIVLQVFYLL